MTLLLNGEFTISQGVPQFNGLVTRSRHDLSVVGRERNRENVTGMSDKSLCRVSGVEVPKSQGRIPGSRKGVLTVRRNDTVGNESVVSLQRTSWYSVLLISGNLPNKQSLVS